MQQNLLQITSQKFMLGTFRMIMVHLKFTILICDAILLWL